MYCEPNRDGFRLVVAIADVSHYVRPGTPLDEEATKRATSVYFPGFVVPMLPETLSNGICSLKPRVDRLCFVCDMQIDRHGEVGTAKFYEAVMNSHARLTYTQVWNAVGEGIPEEDRGQALAFIGQEIAPFKPDHISLGERLQAPSAVHLFGTRPRKCGSCSARRARSRRPACSSATTRTS